MTQPTAVEEFARQLADRLSHRLALILARLGLSEDDRATVEAQPGHWLLIERSGHDGSLYVTRHNGPGRAAAHHTGHEYPEDWSPLALVDLATGTRYMPRVSVTFDVIPRGCNRYGLRRMSAHLGRGEGRIVSAPITRLGDFEQGLVEQTATATPGRKGG